MATIRFHQFEDDASRVRDLIGLGSAIGSLTYGRVDNSELFRAAVVQAVAALDAYVHGVTLDRAVDILLGRLAPGATQQKIGLHFGAVQLLLAAASPGDVEITARTYIAERLARETFQRPDDIGKALAMVGIGKVWSTAFADAETTKTSLGLIIDRRNRIAHSCDRDPLIPDRSPP